MKYHPSSKSLLIEPKTLDSVAGFLLYAIKCVRQTEKLPVEGFDEQGKALTPALYAESAILDCARFLEIDLGADRPGQLNVKKAG